MRYRICSTLSNLCVLVGTLALAAAGAATAQTESRCSDIVYRQLDFLLGHWEVRDSKGNKLGENQIEKTLDGCALSENWTGANNHIGRSYTMYDNRRQVWHQTWVDNSGFLMVMEGGLYDNQILLRGRLQYDLQNREQHRVIWRANNLGKAKQLQRSWEVSRDSGNTWQLATLLYYSKIADKAPSKQP